MATASGIYPALARARSVEKREVALITGMRSLRYLLFLLLAWAATDAGAGRLSAGVVPPICEEVCSSSTVCEELCYENMMEFENGNDITCRQFGVYDTSISCCGDTVCDTAYEMDPLCAADCGPDNQGCQECNPVTQSGCDTGEVCTARSCCKAFGNVRTGPPVCTDLYCDEDSDCCPGNYCYNVPGLNDGVCVDTTPG